LTDASEKQLESLPDQVIEAQAFAEFVSFYFENSTTGKMRLGITFVLSKQYSD
jgi:hypothetical protein